MTRAFCYTSRFNINKVNNFVLFGSSSSSSTSDLILGNSVKFAFCLGVFVEVTKIKIYFLCSRANGVVVVVQFALPRGDISRDDFWDYGVFSASRDVVNNNYAKSKFEFSFCVDCDEDKDCGSFLRMVRRQMGGEEAVTNDCVSELTVTSGMFRLRCFRILPLPG